MKKFTEKQINIMLITAFSFVIIGLFVFVIFISRDNVGGKMEKTTCKKSEILDYINYKNIDNVDMIRYAYQGDETSKQKIIRKNKEFNEVSRTENAIMFENGNEKIAHIYGGSGEFYQKNNKWYEVNFFDIPKSEFDVLAKVSFFEKFLGKEALADTTTTFYSQAGDGQIYVKNSTSPPNQAGWDIAHDAIAGTAAAYTGATDLQVGVQLLNHTTQAWDSDYIHRSFLVFDTSVIPDTDVISAINLVITPQAKVDDYSSATGSAIAIVATTQPATSSLATADFDLCGSVNNPTKYSANVDLGDFTVSAAEIIPLVDTDSNGFGFISKTGFTKIGLRSLLDIDDVFLGTPAEDNNYYRSFITFYASEQTGTSSDPYLEITYAPSATTQPFINPIID